MQASRSLALRAPCSPARTTAQSRSRTPSHDADQLAHTSCIQGGKAESGT